VALDGDGDGQISHEEFRPPHPPEGFGPPGEHRPEAAEGRGGPPGGPGGRGGDFGGPPPRGEGRGPGGGPGGPESFIERAMQFDADGDGKLDRSELTKLAEEMARRRGGPGGGGRGGPGGGPGGPGGDEGGPRPDRPRRPE
jgi:hypothetical protein